MDLKSPNNFSIKIVQLLSKLVGGYERDWKKRKGKLSLCTKNVWPCKRFLI